MHYFLFVFNSSSWLLTWSFNNECSNGSSSCSTTTRRNEMRQKMLHAYDDVHVVRLQITSHCCECDMFKANHMTWYWRRLVEKKVRFWYESFYIMWNFIFIVVIRYNFLGISISFHRKSIHVFQPISIVYFWFRLIRIWRHYLMKLRKSNKKNAISMECALFRSRNWHRKM